uniref:Protein kinase domain-containing protein n=1 Tax=Araucaria cunninghamii TaxID=56994 RepID=A0A0D6R6Q6_ARACU
MGCFMGQRNKKKQAEQNVVKTVIYDNKPVLLPEPVAGSGVDSQEFQSHNGDPRSCPPSFRRKVRTVQHVNWLINNRPRALSAPSSFSRTEQDTSKEIYAKLEHEEEKPPRVSPPPLGTKWAHSVSEAVQPNRGSSQSGPVSPISGPQCSDKKAFSGQPVPLPSPRPRLPHENCGTVRCTVSCSSPLNSASLGTGLKKFGSFKGNNKVPEPMPLPPPKDCSSNLRLFTYEELSSACNGFSQERCVCEGSVSLVYKAYIKDETSGQKIEVAITRFLVNSQTHKEFVNDVNTIALLQHQNLCKLIGYHARENACERMLVYEMAPHGSLDQLLYGRANGPPIDWSTRMRIALGAAQGLAYLHEEGPFQAMYSDFKAANILIDKDFSAKLIDYGFASYSQDMDSASNSCTASAYLAPETLARGFLTPKSNVWSFGVVLLELLTGRRNMGNVYPKEERNLVKWTKFYLTDEYRLSLIMDPRLKGRFSGKAGKIVADLALRCLQKEPCERPTMRVAVEMLKSVQDMKYSSKFPLKEPTSPKNDNSQQFSKQLASSPPRSSLMAMPSYLSQSQPLIITRDSSPVCFPDQPISRSPSLNGLITSSPSHTALSNIALSPLRSLKPIVVPSRSCASTFALEDVLIKQCKETASPRQQPARVEGF